MYHVLAAQEPLVALFIHRRMCAAVLGYELPSFLGNDGND
jgi:hypothetical protein